MMLHKAVRYAQPSQSVHRNVRFGSRLCENSNVRLARRKFVSITLNRKRTALAVTIERRKGRKQFCAFFARARFHTAWVNRYTGDPAASSAMSAMAPKAEVNSEQLAAPLEAGAD
jgi:hypothetical protein